MKIGFFLKIPCASEKGMLFILGQASHRWCYGDEVKSGEWWVPSLGLPLCTFPWCHDTGALDSRKTIPKY